MGGTADAVRQYLWLFEEAVREGVEDFLILSGDHLYRMDYREFVHAHRESGADITIAALPCDEARASASGLMKIDGTGRVTEFAEKPQGQELQDMKVDTTVLGLDAQRAQEEPFIASMGIYVFNARKMIELLTETFPTANDFGTIKAFYESNLALCDAANPSFSFYDKDYPIYTMTRFLPPSKLVECNVERSMIGDGCVIRHGTSVTGSMVGLRSLIGSNSTIEEALIMGADYYETLEECALVAECIPMGIGSSTTLRKCIIDKNARIGSNVQIVNAAGMQEANHEEEGYIIKDGIVVVVKDAVISDGTII